MDVKQLENSAPKTTELMSALAKNRVEFFHLVEQLEEALGRPLDEFTLSGYIDSEASGQTTLTQAQVEELIALLSEE